MNYFTIFYPLQVHLNNFEVYFGFSSHPIGSTTGLCTEPSLFMFYVNDLPQGLYSTVRLFVDDTIFYLTVSSDSDCSKLQSDLDKLAKWENNWKMEFHPEKCTVLTVSKKRNPVKWNYTLHGHILAYETSSKYLGYRYDLT